MLVTDADSVLATTVDNCKLPCHSTVYQWRFVMDVGYIKTMCDVHQSYFPAVAENDDPPGAWWTSVDSSPQGGNNWIMGESYYMFARDFEEVYRLAYQLWALASQLNEEFKAQLTD